MKDQEGLGKEQSKKNFVAETYFSYIQHILEIDLSPKRFPQRLRVLSFGTPNNSDVIAMHMMNPNADFYIMNSNAHSGRDKNSGSEYLSYRIPNDWIQKYLDSSSPLKSNDDGTYLPSLNTPYEDPYDKFSITKYVHVTNVERITDVQADVIIGIGLEFERLKNILQELNHIFYSHNGNFIGIFSIEYGGFSYSDLEALLEQSFGSKWRSQYAIKPSKSVGKQDNDYHDMFAITPKREGNPFLQFFQNDQEQ